MRKNLLTKSLTIGGTVLLWFPILASIIISMIVTLMDKTFRFDYLMPAELAFFALLGGGLLFWGAIRVKANIKPITWLLVSMIVMLLGSQAIAVATGLASGERPPTDGFFYLVIGMLVAYTLCWIMLAILGICLVRAIYKAN